MTDAPAPATEPAAPAKPAFNPPREPHYAWGERVSAVEDLHNDGSHPHVPPNALLIPAGTPGMVVRVGHAPDTNSPVYLVEFPGGVLVGCFEAEIRPVGGPRRGVPGVME